ncbi:MAG TPA: penicillin-binding protein activator [Magnetospirillaceae bacterium]|nr:penicillin-binding protein activator [Magnetospirillaceae bacterium]
MDPQEPLKPHPATPKPASTDSFGAQTTQSPNTALLTPDSPDKKRRIVRTAIIALASIVVIGASYGAFLLYQHYTAQQSPARIKVGLMMAFSGGSSSMGYGANKGIQLAKKQLGADNIEIVQVDSKCDPKAAAEAMRTLIDQKVVAIIGEGCSSASVAALPAANNAKIPMISPSASSPTLSIPNDYFFRVVPPDNLQGSFMAQTIYDQGYRNVAVFYTNEPYGSGMNTVFRESFENLGGKVVASVNAEPDVIDLRMQMEQIKASNPQALFIAPNSVVSATAAMKVAREVGITAPFFGADIMYDTTILTDAPQAAAGLTISSFPTGTKTFKQSLFNEYQRNEQLYAAPQAYDIIHALQLAVQKGATTGEQIRDVLPTLDFEGASGHIKFDTNGEISDKNYKYDLFQVRDNVFTLVDAIN